MTVTDMALGSDVVFTVIAMMTVWIWRVCTSGRYIDVFPFRR